MPPIQLDRMLSLLREREITLAPGLKQREITRIEAKYGFQFPLDLRQLLETALPISPKFPNWRSDMGAALRAKLAWPLEGLCFDVEHNAFWLAGWGPRPADLAQAFACAAQAVAEAPRLIPIFSHRYLPADPNVAGNPVFSVHQTDIIYYGADLPDYFENEFADPRPVRRSITPRPIRFWSALTS